MPGAGCGCRGCPPRSGDLGVGLHQVGDTGVGDADALGPAGGTGSVGDVGEVAQPDRTIQLDGGQVVAGQESSSRSSRPSHSRSPSPRRDRVTSSVMPMVTAESSSMYSMRSSGYDGSMGRKAAPDLAIPHGDDRLGGPVERDGDDALGTRTARDERPGDPVGDGLELRVVEFGVAA